MTRTQKQRNGGELTGGVVRLEVFFAVHRSELLAGLSFVERASHREEGTGGGGEGMPARDCGSQAVGQA